MTAEVWGAIGLAVAAVVGIIVEAIRRSWSAKQERRAEKEKREQEIKQVAGSGDADRVHDLLDRVP